MAAAARALLLALALVGWMGRAIEQWPPEFYPAPYDNKSDKMFYITKQTVNGNIQQAAAQAGMTVRQYVDSLCDEDMPDELLRGTATAYIKLGGSNSSEPLSEWDPNTHSAFNEIYFNSLGTRRYLSPDGAFWYSPNKTTLPRYIGASITSLLDEPGYTGVQPGDAPVRYWTGTDVSWSNNARACVGPDGRRFSSLDYSNTGDDTTSGATIGTGPDYSGVNLLASSVAKCNETLPLLCLARSKGPVPISASLKQSGDLHITFDLPTNGMNKGQFNCTNLLTFSGDSDGTVGAQSFDRCRFSTPQTLIVSFKTDATWNLELNHMIGFVNTQDVEVFAHPIRFYIEGLSSEDGLVPAVSISLPIVAECQNPDRPGVLAGPSVFHTCMTSWVGTILGVSTFGRDLLYGTIRLFPCPDPTDPNWYYAGGSCTRPMTSLELKERKIRLNMTNWDYVNLNGQLLVAIEALNHFASVGYNHACGPAEIWNQNVVQIFVTTPGLVVLPPEPLRLTPSDLITYAPEYTVPPSCMPPGFSMANATFKHEWHISHTQNCRRRLRSDDSGYDLSGDAASKNERSLQQEFPPGLFVIEDRILRIPPYTLKSRRDPGFNEPCYYDAGSIASYTADLVVKMTWDGVETTIIDTRPNNQASLRIEIYPSPIVFDIRTTVASGNTVTIDATRTCDPDIAIEACDVVRKFVPTPDRPSSGVYFNGNAICEVYMKNGEDSLQGSFITCDNERDFVDGTNSPTASPTPYVQSSDPPSPEYEPPFEITSGVTTIRGLKPGIYRFIQPMLSAKYEPVENFVFREEWQSNCEVYQEVPSPFLEYCKPRTGTVLEIRPIVPQCTIPMVEIQPLPQTKVTIFPGSSTVIKSQVLYNGVRATSGVSWEVRDPATDQFYAPSALFNAPALESAQNRPSLTLPSHLLSEGKTYTLRLTARGIGSGCNAASSVSSTITFQVNSRPFGGSVTVSPLSGRSFTDDFTLNCRDWVDEDLPLQYSFSIKRPSDEAVLTSYRTSASLVTKLASRSRIGNFIICNVRDAFGARNTAISASVTIDPLYDAGQGTNNLPDPQSIRQSLANEAEDSKLRTLSALALSALTTKKDAAVEDEEYLKSWRRDVATSTVQAVFEAFNRTSGSGSVDFIGLQINTLLAGVSTEPDLGEVLVEEATDTLKKLVGEAQKVLGATAAAQGVPAPDLLPSGFTGSLLDLLSELSKGIQAGASSLGLIRRRLGAFRSLQEDSENDAYTRALQNLRGSLNSLIGSLMQGYVDGSPVQIAQGIQIEMAVAREARQLLGGNEGITTLSLGDISVTLPPGVLGAEFVRQNINGIDSVDVALVRFKFNIRELVAKAQQPPGFDSNGTEVTVSGAKANDSEVHEVTTLLFLSSTDSNILLDPENLTIPINITVKLPDDYVLPDEASGLELVCGAWDTSFKGWSNKGAVVSYYNPVDKTVICSSTHASDFAAWNAFIANLGGGPIGTIVVVAIIVVGIMLPLIILSYLLALVWAKQQDKKDADGVHVGALLLLTKNKLRLRARQRRFFNLLRENAKQPRPLVLDLAKERQLRREREEELKRIREQQKTYSERIVPESVVRWFKAIYYDHSFVGVFTRFDPYYDRVQRITVIWSVICGNLFIASFFFDLKTADDITFGFMFGVVLLTSLVVALPVKIIVRVLFRSTEAVTGSTMDRVSQIYRVSHIYQDILPIYASAAEQADIEMILAFREYYMAKAQLSHAKAELARAKRFLKGDSILDKVLVAFRLREPIPKGGDLPTASDIVELGVAVDKVSVNVKNASQILREKSAKAKEEWEKVPRRRNARVETLRKQQSSIMRFAALLYDEADAGPPREREKRLKSGFLIVAWTIIIAYLIACLTFTSYWLLAYTSVRPGAQDVQQQDANEVILAWLLASVLGVIIGLFVAEPAIQFIRFGVMPWCLNRFGQGIVPINQSPLVSDSNDDDEEALVVRQQSQDEEAKKGERLEMLEKQVADKKKGEKHTETAGIALFDLAAEVVEALA